MSSLLWRDICPVIVDIYIYMSGYSGDIYVRSGYSRDIYMSSYSGDIYMSSYSRDIICPVIVEIYMSG